MIPNRDETLCGQRLTNTSTPIEKARLGRAQGGAVLSDEADDRFDSAGAARRIGDAVREAQRVLDDVAATPWDQMSVQHSRQASTALDVVLRELLEAIAAVGVGVGVDQVLPVGQARTREDTLATRGLPHAGAGGNRTLAEDSGLWSAMRLHEERLRLDEIAAASVSRIVPGLRAVIEAFPPDFVDVDQFVTLRTPMEALGGSSPIRWLLTGGRASTVASVIRDLSRRP